MRNIKNKVIKKYMRNVWYFFPYRGKKEKVFLKRLKRNLEEYTDEFSNCSYDMLIKQFGHPKDVAIDYFYEKDNDELAKRLRLKKTISCLCFVVVFIATMYSVWKTVDLYQGYWDGVNTHITYDMDQIIYDE